MNETALRVLGAALIAVLLVAARMSPDPAADGAKQPAAGTQSNRLPLGADAPTEPAPIDAAGEASSAPTAANVIVGVPREIPVISPTVTYRVVKATVASAPVRRADPNAPDPSDETPGEADPIPVEEQTQSLAIAEVSGPDISTMEILEAEVAPGTLVQLQWKPKQTFDGINRPVPVLVARGEKPGPTMCFVAAVHGDELNGIEVVRRVLYEVNPEKLKGTLIGVPIVNLQGFARNSRYLPDRRDLNRYFPGNPRGSAASRLAYSFFNEVMRHCHTLVDLHTGSFHRTNLPQIRANLNNDDVVTLTRGFGSTLVLHSEGPIGTLRRSAVDAGIPAVTFEIGEPMRLQDDQVKHAVKAVFSLLDKFNVYGRRSLWGAPEPVYYQSKWVRADAGGILLSSVKLGARVRKDQVLGTVTDPITNSSDEILSPFNGRVIGMAVDQFVMPGYAAYHIGIEAEVDAEDFEPAPEDEESPDFEHAE